MSTMAPEKPDRSRGGLLGLYGAGPLHLLAVLVSFAIAGYGFLRIFDSPDAFNVLLWFGGAIIAHDVIAFPIYSGLGLIAYGALGRPRERDAEVPQVSVLNHVRVPLLLSAFTFIAWFPLILGLGEERFNDQTGLSTDVYLGRWLLLTAALLAISAVVYAVRLRKARQDPG